MAKRTSKNKPKPFHLLTPDVKTIYLGTGARQRASYLQLPDQFNRNFLEEDVKNGAVMYENLLENEELTQYNIITANNLEDGYRAVTYLAGLQAVSEDPEETFDTKDTDCLLWEGCDKEYSFDEGNSEDSWEEDPDLYEDENCYLEDIKRLPLIPIHEITNLEEQFMAHQFMGNYTLEFQNNNNRRPPWWADCTEESVCIVVQRQASGNYGFMDMMPASAGTLLNDQEIRSLKRFAANRHVYLLLIGDNIQKDDISISRAMLDYTADYYYLNQSAAQCRKYHHALFQCMLQKYDYSLSSTVDSVLLAEKLAMINPGFPCASFENVMLYLKHIHAKSKLDSSDFRRFGLEQTIQKRPDSRINEDLFDHKLFGMEHVRSQLDHIMNCLRFNKMRVEHGLPPIAFHKVFLFVGAPGTAKTTVAQILCNKMAGEGFLKGGRFISISGAQLKGAFVGQTAPKVHSLFESYDAIFIDEAYSLTSSDLDGMDSYAQEALAQLAIELETHSDDKLIIFAGYGGRKVSRTNNRMKNFIDANPGIKSRINSTIYFDSYAPMDMVQIVHHLADLNHLTMDKQCDSLISDYFAARRHADDFGNGREARNLLEQCELYMANRLIRATSEEGRTAGTHELSVILPEDLQPAIDSLKEMDMQQKGICAHKIGF